MPNYKNDIKNYYNFVLSWSLFTIEQEAVGAQDEADVQEVDNIHEAVDVQVDVDVQETVNGHNYQNIDDLVQGQLGTTLNSKSNASYTNKRNVEDEELHDVLAASEDIKSSKRKCTTSNTSR